MRFKVPARLALHGASMLTREVGEGGAAFFVPSEAKVFEDDAVNGSLHHMERVAW